MEENKILKSYKSNFIDYLKYIKKWVLIGDASLKKEEDITHAIKIAYSTASRTFKFEDKKEGDNNFSILAKEFIKYFDGTISDQNKFDKIHQQLCEFIQNNRDKIFVRKCKDGVPSYGQCQKIVNVTLKILSCFKDAEENQDYFSFGHMILDRYTLNWYRKQCGGERNITWSKLDRKKYQKIQEDMRAKFQPMYYDISLPDNIFQAEFIIWWEERQAATTKRKK